MPLHLASFSRAPSRGLPESLIVNPYTKTSPNEMSTLVNGTQPYTPMGLFPAELSRQLTIQIYAGIASFAVIPTRPLSLGDRQLMRRVPISRYSYGTSSYMSQMNISCSRSTVSLK